MWGISRQARRNLRHETAELDALHSKILRLPVHRFDDVILPKRIVK